MTSSLRRDDPPTDVVAPKAAPSTRPRPRIRPVLLTHLAAALLALLGVVALTFLVGPIEQLRTPKCGYLMLAIAGLQRWSAPAGRSPWGTALSCSSAPTPRL